MLLWKQPEIDVSNVANFLPLWVYLQSVHELGFPVCDAAERVADVERGDDGDIAE